jgi:hypothetical protein
MTNNPPPAAHPPEGSREHTACDRCARDLGDKAYCSRCATPPPGPLLDTCELCGVGKVWPAPPPGPGQDVETQARALHELVVPGFDHVMWGSLVGECGTCELILRALRAAQAEVEEAQLGVEGRCQVGHNKRFTFELLGRIGCVACERDAAERRAQEKEEELIILREKLAEHTNCVKRDSSGFCCGASRDRNANILMHLEINRRRNR